MIDLKCYLFISSFFWRGPWCTPHLKAVESDLFQPLSDYYSFLCMVFFCKRAFYQKSAAAALAFAACSPFLVMMRTKTSSHSLDRIGQLPFRAAPEPIVWKWKIAFYCMHPIFELKRDFHEMNEGKALVWPTIVSSIGQRQAPLTPIQNSFTLTPN